MKKKRKMRECIFITYTQTPLIRTPLIRARPSTGHLTRIAHAQARHVITRGPSQLAEQDGRAASCAAWINAEIPPVEAEKVSGDTGEDGDCA